MTTDRPPRRAVPAGEKGAAGDRRERLERLRERRASSVASSGGGSEDDHRRRRPGRAHAAAGGRVLAAGLSAGAALALVAAMAGFPPSANPASPSDAPAPVVVVRRSSGTAVPAGSGPAPALAPTKAPPVTTSAAS